MEEMLSGFIGALIATILSVVYLYIAEQIRQRTDIALEVVGYCDEVGGIDRGRLTEVYIRPGDQSADG